MAGEIYRNLLGTRFRYVRRTFQMKRQIIDSIKTDVRNTKVIHSGRVLFRIPFTLYFLVQIDVDDKKFLALARKHFHKNGSYIWEML